MMFNKISMTSFLLAVPMIARAVVVPSEPGPGARYTAGQTCAVTWDGDRDSDTIWKDMSIQLMSGSNFDMVHLTTIATGQDGTISGRFTYPCPEVDPYSTIYFYQFSSPHTDEKTWTTRFTITSPDGEVVPPSEATQPGTGDAIPWGVGNLVDPSAAQPPPVIGTATPSGDVSASGSAVRPTATSASLRASSSGTARPTASANASGTAISASEAEGSASAPSAGLKLVALAVSAISLAIFA